METKKLIMFLGIFVVALLALNFLSAEAVVNYSVFTGLIQNNGDLTISVTPVSNFDYVGYVCLDASCATIGAQVPGLTGHSNTNTLTAVFPTTLMNNNGYTIYVYKQGYIGWIQKNMVRYGNSNLVSSTNFYLSKKLNGYAPINNLSVKRETEQYKPFEVNVSLDIDSSTYSAIQKNFISGIPLNEDVQTSVRMDVINSSNSVIYTQTQNININYSGTYQVHFDYPGFSQTGNYTIKVTTNVPDAKILNSQEMYAQANIVVVPQNLYNHSYSIINNFVYVPTFANVNQTVNFSLDALSYYMDNNGFVFNKDTNVNVSIYQNSNLISNKNYVLVVPNIHLVFNHTFNQSGTYTIVASALPVNPMGTVSGASQSLILNINSASNQTNQTNSTVPAITINTPVNGNTYNTSALTLSVSSNQIVNWIYSLNGVNTSAGQSNWFITTFTAQEGANTIRVYGSNVNGTGLSAVSFKVDLGGNNNKKVSNQACSNLSLESYALSNQTIILNTKPALGNQFNLKLWLYWLIIVILILLIVIVIIYLVRAG